MTIDRQKFNFRKWPHTIFTFLVLLFSTFIFPLTTQAASSDLDPSFGTGGIVTTPVTTSTTSDATVYALAVQPDGKLVTAGLTYSYNDSFTILTSRFALARYNADGSLDASFGAAGIVTTAVGPYDDTAQAVIIQPDGKIVAAGNTDTTTSDHSAHRFALVRYNPDGSLDTFFGNGGIVTTPVGSDDGIFGLTRQLDGKLVAVGFSTQGGNSRFAVVRYNTNGSLDTSFGAGGIMTTPIGVKDTARTVAMEGAKIIVAGDTNNGIDYDFAVARYNPDGSLDTTFNPAGSIPGVVVTDFTYYDDAAYAVGLQGNKIVAVGYSNKGRPAQYKFALARYNDDGSLDSTFGTGGTVTTAIGADYDQAVAVAVQGSKILVAGYSDQNGSFLFDIALVRYNVDGSLDSTFGNGGIVTTDIGTGSDFARSLIVQPNGRIVVSGESKNGAGHYDFALVRYLGEPNQPPSADSLTPVNISTVPGTAQAFTAVYSDPDGWQNISDADLFISGAGQSELLDYSPATNKFSLQGASGDCSPGNGAVLSNGSMNLNCGSSSISGSGTQLTVTFNLTPQPVLSGVPYLLIITAIDQNGTVNNKTAGNWIVNRSPGAGPASPMNSTTSTGTLQTFTIVYSDPDGWQNIAAANFYMSGNGGAINQWLHYLVAPNLFTMMGTNDVCSPGQAKTLSNGSLSFNCAASIISGSGTNVTIVFKVTPLSGGILYNFFNGASDQAGAALGVFGGTWQIP